MDRVTGVLLGIATVLLFCCLPLGLFATFLIGWHGPLVVYRDCLDAVSERFPGAEVRLDEPEHVDNGYDRYDVYVTQGEIVSSDSTARVLCETDYDEGEAWVSTIRVGDDIREYAD